SSGERGGELDGRSCGRADDEVGPGVGAVAVDRGDLPDGAGGTMQATDEEAVDADELTGAVGVDVRLGFGLAWRLERRAVASDERQPLRTSVQAVPDECLVDTVGRDEQAAPLGPGE